MVGYAQGYKIDRTKISHNVVVLYLTETLEGKLKEKQPLNYDHWPINSDE